MEMMPKKKNLTFIIGNTPHVLFSIFVEELKNASSILFITYVKSSIYSGDWEICDLGFEGQLVRI